MSSENTKNDPKAATEKKAAPGEGIRSMRATYAFRAINFELYAKPSKCWKMNFALIVRLNFNELTFQDVVIMGIGLVAITSVFGYIIYMRSKYEGLGYYSAIKEDGTEVFEKKKSRWERWSHKGPFN